MQPTTFRGENKPSKLMLQKNKSIPVAQYQDTKSALLCSAQVHLPWRADRNLQTGKKKKKN